MKKSFLFLAILFLFVFISCGEEKENEKSCSCEEEKAEIIKEVGAEPSSTKNCKNGAEILFFGGGKSAIFKFELDNEKDSCCKVTEIYADGLSEELNKCGAK